MDKNLFILPMLKTIETSSFVKEAVDRVKRGDKVWITGRSASGKSHLAAALQKDGVSVVALDKFGKKDVVADKTRWVVSLPQDLVKTAQAFEGQADNLKAVAKAIISGLAEKQRLTVFIVLPGIELFRSANEAKGKEATSRGASVWGPSWLAKAKWNASQIKAFNKESVENVIISVGAAMGELFDDTVMSDLSELTVKESFWDWAREQEVLDKTDQIVSDLTEIGVDLMIVKNNPVVKGMTLVGWAETSKKEGDANG